MHRKNRNASGKENPKKVNINWNQYSHSWLLDINNDARSGKYQNQNLSPLLSNNTAKITLSILAKAHMISMFHNTRQKYYFKF